MNSEKQAKEVERRIRGCIRHGGLALDLSNLELTSVPDGVRGLTKLGRLSLAYNLITEIPTWIDKLTELRTLSLSGNPLGGLPSSISRLKNLLHLIIVGGATNMSLGVIRELRN